MEKYPKIGEKTMRKTKFLIVLMIAIVIFSTTAIKADTTNNIPNIKVSLLKYEPFPAEPGKYVAITLKIENIGDADADNVRLKLIADYPFSLDTNSTIQISSSSERTPLDDNMTVTLGKLPVSEYTLVEYEIRLAADTLEGGHQLISYS